MDNILRSPNTCGVGFDVAYRSKSSAAYIGSEISAPTRLLSGMVFSFIGIRALGFDLHEFDCLKSCFNLYVWLFLFEKY